MESIEIPIDREYTGEAPVKFPQIVIHSTDVAGLQSEKMPTNRP
jgi:hypothetical protein